MYGAHSSLLWDGNGFKGTRPVFGSALLRLRLAIGILLGSLLGLGTSSFSQSPFSLNHKGSRLKMAVTGIGYFYAPDLPVSVLHFQQKMIVPSDQ